MISPLNTERLIIFPLHYGLIKCLLAHKTDEVEKLGFHTLNRWPEEDTLTFLPAVLKRLEESDYFTGFETWMIVKKDDLSVIGDAGFKCLPDSKGATEIGYGIIEAERQRGYAFEAVSALVKWSFSQNNVLTIYADCLKENYASIKTLQKCGFKKTYSDNSSIYWRLNRFSVSNPLFGKILLLYNSLFNKRIEYNNFTQ